MSSREKSGEGDVTVRLHFVIADRLIPRFCLFLQHGFMLKAHVGCSVNSFLREQIGVTHEFIQDRIQTVILEGRPVDDLDSALIKDGSRLALSAAMPGLVGATMRRGGVYSSLRSAITYRAGGDQSPATEGFVQLKLFNLLMDELGPSLLRRGILLKSSALAGFLEDQSRDFWQGCGEIVLNGKPVEPDLFRGGDVLGRYELVDLSLRSL